MRRFIVFIGVLLALPAVAAADGGSPYLCHAQAALEQVQSERGGTLSKKASRALSKALKALDAGPADFRSQVRTFRKVAKLANKLGADSPGGVLDAAATGFMVEILDAIERGREKLASLPGKNTSKLRRKAEKLLDACEAALAAQQAGQPASARAAKLQKAVAKIRAALAVFGKLNAEVRATWVQCDSVGAVGTPYVTGVNCRTVLVDGYLRRFVVYVPDAAVLKIPPPLVVMHHGTGATGEKFLNISGWREKADEVGLVCAFPTALEYLVLENGWIQTKWHALGLDGDVDLKVRPAGYPEAAPWPADDLEFENLVLDDLEDGVPFGVDPTRLFATGFSNGAAFTQRLAFELSDRFDAAASSGGFLPQSVGTPASRIPLIAIIGTDDQMLLDIYNASHPPIPDFPLDPDDFFALPLLDNGVRSVLKSFELEFDPHDEVENATWTGYRFATPSAGNTSGNVFEHVILDGLMHIYPAPGRPNFNPHGFSAADILWDFFTAEVP